MNNFISSIGNWFTAIDWTEVAFSVPALLLALTFHEFCHGLAATALGDDTPRLQGRLSINPLRHLDPVGTLLLFLFKFGWAKPVEVNPLKFRCNRKLGMALVGVAGPLSNLVLALISAYCMKFIDSGVIPYNPYFYTFFYMLMIYNVCFAAFNILPFPPLDGSKVIAAIIPDEWSEFLYGNRQLFMLILVVLMTTGYVTKFMQPVVGWLYYFIDLLVF
jgi:Zn-dependent protease